jgi:hypothetical protein
LRVALALALAAGAAVPAARAQTPTPLPPPVAGKTVNLKLLQGTVLYKVPGAQDFVPLTQEVQVPVDTTLDTVKGRVNITAANRTAGGTNKSWFYDGVFTVCKGTITRVVRGVVAVRELRTGKTILLRAGEQYLARAKKQ